MGKRVYKAVLWITLLSLAGTTLLSMLLGRLGMGRSGVVATVNGRSISARSLELKKAELTSEIRELRARLGSYADSILEMQGLSGKPQDIAMRVLVQKAVLADAANKSGFFHMAPQYVSERVGDVSFVMRTMPELLPLHLFKGGRLDGQALQKHLRRSGISLSDFEQQVEDVVSLSVFESVLPSFAYSPESEKRISEQEEKMQRSFSLIKIPFSTFVSLESKKSISDGELKAFYDKENAASKRYWSEDVRSGTAWSFSADSYGIQANEVEIRRYYTQHLTDFDKKPFDEVKAKVERAVKLDKFKHRFAVESKQIQGALVDDFASKHGGVKRVLSHLSKKALSKSSENQAENILFEISRPGQTKAAIVDKGAILVRLDTYEAGSVIPFEKVRERVRADLIEERALFAMNNELKRLCNLSSSKDFDEALKIFTGVSVQKLSNLSSKSEQWVSLEKDKLPVARMKKMFHPHAALFHMSKEQGVIVVLDKVAVDENAVVGKEMSTGPSNLDLQLFSTGFIASLNRSATIKYYEKSQRPEPVYYEE